MDSWNLKCEERNQQNAPTRCARVTCCYPSLRMIYVTSTAKRTSKVGHSQIFFFYSTQRTYVSKEYNSTNYILLRVYTYIFLYYILIETVWSVRRTLIICMEQLQGRIKYFFKQLSICEILWSNREQNGVFKVLYLYIYIYIYIYIPMSNTFLSYCRQF